MKSIRAILLSAVALWAVTARAAVTAETIDGADFSGLGSRAFFVDSSNHEHAVFGYSNIYYAYFDGSNWSLTLVDDLDVENSAFSTQALVVDSGGFVHVIYNRNDDLYYATNSSGSWQSQIISQTLETVSDYAALAVDSDKHAHVSYYDSTGDALHYASNATGEFVNENLGSGKGQYNSIAVDSGNKPYISYQQSGDLLYARKNGTGDWVFDVVDADTDDSGYYSAIVIDASDNIGISYYDSDSGELKFAASNASPEWEPQVISSVASGLSSLAIDSVGKVHLTYYDSALSDAKHAQADSFISSFTVDSIATDNESGRYASVGINASNEPVVLFLYYNASVKHLKVSTKTGGSWSVPTEVFESRSVNSNSGLDIKIDADGFLHLVYVLSTGDLEYATNASGDWVITTIDDTTANPSLALDSQGFAHISYYKSTLRDLYYATNASGSWDTSVADSGTLMPDTSGNVGQHSTIAIDSDDLPHIAYNDVDLESLIYISYDGSSWSLQTSQGNLNGDQNPALLLDSNDAASICYFKSGPGSGCLNEDSGDWNFDLAEGFGTDLDVAAMDSAGHVYLAYYEYGIALHYADHVSGDWEIETLLSSDSLSILSLSTAVDSQGRVFIGYGNQDEDLVIRLKYFTNATGDWQTTTISSTDNFGSKNAVAMTDEHIYFASVSEYDSRLQVFSIDAPAVPTTESECSDAIDNDTDGDIDCNDSDCAADAACLPTRETICSDGLDDDSDGAIDCDDSDCAADAVCATPANETVCTDSLDDDSDGSVDCDDSDCTSDAACATSANENLCSDGLDNDSDGDIDCDDSDCSSDTACVSSGGSSGGGCSLQPNMAAPAGASVVLAFLALGLVLSFRVRL